jgi:hypothetical protein
MAFHLRHAGLHRPIDTRGAWLGDNQHVERQLAVTALGRQIVRYVLVYPPDIAIPALEWALALAKRAESREAIEIPPKPMIDPATGKHVMADRDGKIRHVGSAVGMFVLVLAASAVYMHFR